MSSYAALPAQDLEDLIARLEARVRNLRAAPPTELARRLRDRYLEQLDRARAELERRRT